METDSATTRRKPRADSVRNRESLLEAAAHVFAAGGPHASLETVARNAGVGIGTLYRHFPTREDLFEAVYRHEVDHLADLAGTLAKGPDPVEALRTWTRAYAGLAATKKGMIAALQLVAYGSSDLKTYSVDRLTWAIGLLLEQAVVAGKIRDDISPEDIQRTLTAIIYSQSADEWRPTALRLVDVFVDGLRVR